MLTSNRFSSMAFSYFSQYSNLSVEDIPYFWESKCNPNRYGSDEISLHRCRTDRIDRNAVRSELAGRYLRQVFNGGFTASPSNRNAVATVVKLTIRPPPCLTITLPASRITKKLPSTLVRKISWTVCSGVRNI